MENFSGLLPFLWKSLKKPQQERKPQPELAPLSLHDNNILDDRDAHQDDEEYFLHPELATKSPARFPKSPSMFGRSPGRMSSLHKRRLPTGFSLHRLLSSHR